MAQYGLLIDYEWCSGCRSCEIACQMEHSLPPDRFGVKVVELGPWEMREDQWQHSFMPLFTDECNLCAQRVGKGELPSCVKHCQAAVLTFGPVEELVKGLETKAKQMIIVPHQACCHNQAV